MPIRFDPTADEQRRRDAALTRVVYEWLWGRGNPGDELTGPAGDLFEAEIEKRFAAGPKAIPLVDKDGEPTGRYGGRGVRWRQLGAVADLTVSPLQDIAQQLQLLVPPVVSGDITGPAWDWLWTRSDYGRMFLGRQSGVIGLQSMAVRPVLEEYVNGQYYPAALVEVPPDRAFAIADPSRPGSPAVFGCAIDDGDGRVYDARGHRWQRGGWYIWDLSRPDWPVWGQWDSPQAWQDGRNPAWVMEGRAYPWWWEGRPIVGGVCQQWDQRTRELLPCRRSEAQAALDLLIQRAWLGYLEHQAGIARTFLMSDQPLEGFGQMLNEPGAITNIFGAGSKQLQQVSASTPDLLMLKTMHRERYEGWGRRFDAGFEVQKTEAESGVAIQLRSSAKFRLRRQQTIRARVIDTECVKLLVSTHNYLTRSGQLSPFWGSPGYIPEGAISLHYPVAMDALEAEAYAKEVKEAVDRGEEYAERLHLLTRGIDGAAPGSPEWEEASAYIDGALTAAAARAARGYGVRPEYRAQMAITTPGDESQQYIPPSDVADTASRGLALRVQFRRGLDRSNASGRFLYGRAVGLQQQTPMLLGDVRALRTWLQQHKDDGAHPADVGQWGNDLDPSAAWVEYLSQGGDPGLAWSEATTAGEGGGV